MSPEDDLLRDLGKLARDRSAEERRRLGEEWDRLAAGELSPEEEAALAERASRSPEGSEEAQAFEAFRPLGEDFQVRLVGAIREQRKREVAAEEGLAPPSPPAIPPLAFRPRGRLRGPVAWGAGLAAAAALAGVLVTRPGPPLPAYTAELAGGVRPERGAAGAPPAIYTPGSRFELVLQPATAISGEVEVRCVIARRGAIATQDWPPCAGAERAEGGSLRVAGTVGRDIPYQPGEWTLWVIVVRTRPLGALGRRGSPTDAELRRLKPGAVLAGPGWSALRVAEPIRFGAAS